MAQFCIVVCTYNPEMETFQRVVEAIKNLNVPSGASLEYCFVDNNSSPGIATFPFIQSFLSERDNSKVIIETKQGQTHARIAGVNSTSAPFIVFFDDDNLPGQDYIINLSKTISLFPDVAVWGPGRIEVVYTEPVEKWMDNYKWFYQDRNVTKTMFGQEKRWTSYYPAGTGQVVRRDVMDRYLYSLYNNELTLTGRDGKTLTCGEDAQIVYTAIKMGFLAGLEPGLTLQHLIPEKRTRVGYIKKLLYGIMSSGAIANIEIFPEEKEFYLGKINNRSKILFRLIKIVGSGIKSKSMNQFYINSAYYLGEVSGCYQVSHGKIPLWVKTLNKILKIN